MPQKIIFLEEFGKAFIPKRFRPKMGEYLMKAGYTEVPYKLYGVFFYLSLLITGGIFITLVNPQMRYMPLFKVLVLSFLSWAGIQLFVVFFIGLIYYIYMEQKIYMRTQKMEDVLEDFLHLVSENLKGGLTLEEALWDAVRPEFGVLSNEIKLTAKKVMTGEDVPDALTDFMMKYNSPMLTRSFNLIVQSISGGGKLSDIIDKVIRNIIETKRLKKEMGATNLTYVIFISFVVVVVTPALFTLSNQFLRILGLFSVASTGTMVASSNFPLSFGAVSIDPSLFKKFSIYAIGTISVFASMIISIIRRGSIRAGIRLIPIYLIASFVMYALISQIAQTVIGAYFGLQ